MKKRILMMICLLAALFMPMLDMTAMTAQAAVTPAVVELSDTDIVLDLAESSRYQLKAEVLPEDASQRIKWSTSSSSIVKVSSERTLPAPSLRRINEPSPLREFSLSVGKNATSLPIFFMSPSLSFSSFSAVAPTVIIRLLHRFVNLSSYFK